jgi:heptosyltransferase-2
MSRRRVPVPAGGFRRIAVLRLSSLGDVILALPVVRALHEAYPEARIDVWVKEEYQDVVRGASGVHHVRALERDARRLEDLVSMSAELEDCDLIVDLHGNARTRLLTFRQRAPVLRAPSYRMRRWRWVRARWTRPAPTPHALERYAQALQPIGLTVSGTPAVVVDEAAERWGRDFEASWPSPGPRPVALAPGARHWTKRWPEEHWLALHAALAEQGHRQVVLATREDRARFPALAGQVESTAGSRWVEEPLARVAALLPYCAAAVTGDSGLMHLAAARGLRVVAMFGSTAPELGFAPAGEGHAVLCRHEPCQPCTLHGLDRCPKTHFRCMRQLRAETVEAAVRERLG